MNFLVTGGAGFIGSHLVEKLLAGKHNVTVADCVTYAGNHDFIQKLTHRDDFHWWNIDIRNYAEVESLLLSNYDGIFHLAAESHVDNSISGPKDFITTNINGTFNILDAMRKNSLKSRLIYVSTDEVYGMLKTDWECPFIETDTLNPSSPYSASKAAADLLTLSYNKTYGLDTVITRCTNNYGPRQHKEKLIPKAITNILAKKKVPIYGNGSNMRNWIHVEDHCNGLIKAFESGKSGEIYNFGNNDGLISNNDLIQLICKIMEVEFSESIEYVADRKGHDLIYNIRSEKAKSLLKWDTYKSNLWDGLTDTVDWYMKESGS